MKDDVLWNMDEARARREQENRTARRLLLFEQMRQIGDLGMSVELVYDGEHKLWIARTISKNHRTRGFSSILEYEAMQKLWDFYFEK